MSKIVDTRHLRNLNEIHRFLRDNEIEYSVDVDEDERTFFLNNDKLELRYVDSENHKMDYTKRFGIKGIPHNYFINITKRNKEFGIRTIWIKDWEIETARTITDIDGNELKDYRRKWNVLQSYIKTAVGKIDTRIYARDCEVRIIPPSQLRPFLEKNCFYGYRSATVNLGLYLKKDKNGIKSGTLVFMTSFGHPFYSKGLYDVEVVRVSSKLFCQVIGGASKLLKHFLVNYPTMIVGGKERLTEKIVFLCDADHNDARSLETLGYKFVSHDSPGFMNVDIETGEVFHRKPMQHKLIMQKMAEGLIYSVANAGTIVYKLSRSEYMKENNIEEKQKPTDWFK